MKVFVGHDWAEAHHDIHIEDEQGARLAKARLAEGVEGVAGFHELVASFVDDPAEVTIATETDRGLFVAAMVAAGYRVLAVNPMSTSRYRERHSTSGAKSDPGDAFVLAELARTDAHNHRPVAGDSELGEAIKVLARAHQSLIWTRQRQLNQLRSTLREFYPGALEAFDELGSGDALAVLAIAPTPTLGQGLSRSKIASALRRGGRQRRVDERAIEIQTVLRGEQLEAPPIVAGAMGATVTALVAVAVELTTQIDRLETELSEHFEVHPDAKIIRSLPGLGMILGARVLAEFGDDPNRYASAKCRKNYAGMSPITRASGKHRVVLARYARNKRLADACHQWAFCALTASPGARTFYDQHRTAGDTHHRALRALANRLVGILHGCLHHETLYDEHTAWAHRAQLAA
ncbi:MAG TPA: IS110 family transposase [Acidimicrobiia bacterium]|nr:IS110 family transposase [Acidimicrobiia bacterium]